jgi:hypothetical protein
LFAQIPGCQHWLSRITPLDSYHWSNLSGHDYQLTKKNTSTSVFETDSYVWSKW